MKPTSLSQTSLQTMLGFIDNISSDTIHKANAKDASELFDLLKNLLIIQPPIWHGSDYVLNRYIDKVGQFFSFSLFCYLSTWMLDLTLPLSNATSQSLVSLLDKVSQGNILHSYMHSNQFNLNEIVTLVKNLHIIGSTWSNSERLLINISLLLQLIQSDPLNTTNTTRTLDALFKDDIIISAIKSGNQTLRNLCAFRLANVDAPIIHKFSWEMPYANMESYKTDLHEFLVGDTQGPFTVGFNSITEARSFKRDYCIHVKNRYSISGQEPTGSGKKAQVIIRKTADLDNALLRADMEINAINQKERDYYQDLLREADNSENRLSAPHVGTENQFEVYDLTVE